jgi:glycosyltransferase involved in cell wall biosynthesis
MNEVLPKISIISPSYNQGKYIEEAILSVLNQHYANFEHIIIDGGSTDSTLNIIKKYPHVRWVSEKDSGQSDALNKGFQLATGEILGWLNTDDLYLPGAFYSVLTTIVRKNVDAVYGNYSFIDSNGKITKQIITQNSKKWMSLYYCFIPSTTFFFKRTILDEGVGVDKNFHIAMDKEFFAHLYYKGYTIEKINSFVAYFRWHDRNKSLDTKENRRTRQKEGIEIFRRYSQLNVPKKIDTVFYHTIKFYCGLYRFICRRLHYDLYN